MANVTGLVAETISSVIIAPGVLGSLETGILEELAMIFRDLISVSL